MSKLINYLTESLAYLTRLSFIIVVVVRNPIVIIVINWLIGKATGTYPLDIKMSIMSILSLVIVSIVYSLVLLGAKIVITLLLEIANNISVILTTLTTIIVIPGYIYMLYAGLKFALDMAKIGYVNNYVIICLAIFYYLTRQKYEDKE